jgi:hypothetical protein
MRSSSPSRYSHSVVSSVRQTMRWGPCMAPTLVTSCTALPPEGAFAPWGGPAALNAIFMRRLYFGCQRSVR